MMIVAGVLLLNFWTISIIVRAADKYAVFDLGSVIRQLPGRAGPALEFITNVFVWISMFLCLVSYIIVIHDSAENFVKDTWLDNRLLLVTLASILVLPLTFLSQRLLEKTSTVAIAINVYLFVLVGVLYCQQASNDNLPQSCIFGVTIKGNFAMITVMFQAVIVQMCVLPMYQELEDRSPQKFDKIVAVGFGVLFFIFCGFASVSYMLYGPTVESDILTQLPHNAWGDLAKIGVIFVVACVYPIMVYPMIAPLIASDGMFGMSPTVLATSAKFVIVLGALLVASRVDSLGVVNVINGAMSAAVFVALVPSVVGLCLLDTSPPGKIALTVLLVVGLLVSGLGFIFKENYVDDLKCSLYT